MIVSCRDMILNGQKVVAGQVLDGIWPDLRELARRNLLRQRWVEEIGAATTTTAPVEVTNTPGMEQVVMDPPKRKRGRPKGSKNTPKPVAQAPA